MTAIAFYAFTVSKVCLCLLATSVTGVSIILQIRCARYSTEVGKTTLSKLTQLWRDYGNLLHAYSIVLPVI